MATPEWYRYGPGFTIDGLLIALMFVQLLQLNGQGPWRALDWRWVRWLGTLSYPCYLYHQWGLGLGHKFRMLPAGGQLVVGMLATLGFAVGSYYVVERPMLSLRKRFTAGATPALATADRPSA
jgi:peptidoglycan/LPS O-acetylase OafA/YrhL